MRRRVQKSISRFFTEMFLLFRKSFMMIYKNFFLIVAFLIIYSVFNIALTYMLVNFLTSIALKLTGFTYIGPDNMLKFIRAPGTILLLLLLSICMCLLHIMEMSSLMHAYSLSMTGRKATLKGMISAGILSSAKTFHPRNWLILPFILILMPLSGFFSFSFNSLQANIPGFVQEFINENKLYHILYLGFDFILLLIVITYIYAMNFYLLGNKSFSDSCKESRKLISKHRIITVFYMWFAAVLFSIIVTGITTAATTVLHELTTLSPIIKSKTDELRLAHWIVVTNDFMAYITAPAINVASLTTLFFHYLKEKPMISLLKNEDYEERMLSRRLALSLIAALIGLLSFTLYNSFPYFLAPKNEELSRPAIVAHRGDSVNAPENTRPAFELALLENADWVELDVEQTSDGEIVVCHDDNLQRICGKKLYVHNLTLPEIRQLDIGSWFSKDFSDVRISTLDEILKLYKNQIPVQIEIKYSGYNNRLEENILKIVNKNGMHDQVIITSLKSKPLKRIKELDPTMITTYSMFFSWQHIEDIPYSDYYTVEESNIDPMLVYNVHSAGGKIFAWTVNSEDSVQYLVDCEVDGILTDDPNMMKKALENCKYTSGIQQYFRLFTDAMRKY